MRRQILLTVLVLVLLVGGIGCDLIKINTPKDPKKRVEDWYSPTNPKIALQNLEWCYNFTMYYDKYDTLIHDNFTFYFSEHDQNNQDNPLPATYNKTEDLGATLRLFENDDIGAENIDLTLSIPDDYLPPSDDVDGATDRINHVPYDLYVTVPSQSVTYHASHTASFEMTRQDDVDGTEARWYISKWWDEYTGS